MPRLVAKAGVPYVVVHWRGHSHDMYSRAVYANVVREVHDELAQRVGAVIAEGVDPSMIVLDPGLGFSKNPAPVGPEAHNWQLVAGLPELARIGGRDFPVLVGAGQVGVGIAQDAAFLFLGEEGQDAGRCLAALGEVVVVQPRGVATVGDGVKVQSKGTPRREQHGGQCLDPARGMQQPPEGGAARMRTQPLIGEPHRDCVAPLLKLNPPATVW